MTSAVQTKHALMAMDKTGDTRVEWDPENEDEVTVARKAFERLIKKGYMAYRTLREDSRGEQLRTFDPSAERIVLVPPMAGG